MEGYDIMGACQHVTAFLDAMNNWYIRRSRNSRFWKSEQDQDKRDAYDTLYTVLVTLTKHGRAAAPDAQRGDLPRPDRVSAACISTDWPDVSDVACARGPRRGHGSSARRRARPGSRCASRTSCASACRCASVTVAGEGAERLTAYADLIRDELNVKQVEVGRATWRQYGSFQLQVNARTVGPRLGDDDEEGHEARRRRATGSAARRRHGQWSAASALEAGEFTLRLVPKEGVASAALPTNDGVCVLDVEVTPELEREGRARDFVRLVQQARKDAGLHVSDRITLLAESEHEAVYDALEEHGEYICQQTLADRVVRADGPRLEREGEIGGLRVTFALSPVERNG